jgi:hypothetical protein
MMEIGGGRKWIPEENETKKFDWEIATGLAGCVLYLEINIILMFKLRF